MNVAYVDTSCLVAIAFGEGSSSALARRLEGLDEVYSSNLLEAELLASFAREDVPPDEGLLSWITWILPNRPITAEIAAVLSAGYLRGAHLWHVACALYLDQEAREIPFLTLDDRQGSVARGLGFPT